MKINKNICMLGLGAFLLLPLSCSKDFLEQKNTQDITEQSLFKKPEDGIRLVNAIYDTFHNVDFTLKALWYQANFLTQDFKNYGADTFYETYEVPTTFDALEVFWVRSYQGIARANSAIPIIAKMKEEGVLTEELANRLSGEAYFLRGVFHYYLAANFGGVPIELKTVTDNGRHARNTEEEVYAAVENDMKTAYDLLEWKEALPNSEKGRATKGAALAYLGEAQMWLKKYDDAIKTYEQLEGKYQLEETFLNVNAYNNRNGKESIFELQFIAPEGSDQTWGHANDSHWLSTFGMPQEVGNFGYAYADKKLFDSFEAGDSRRRATVIGPGETHPDPLINIKDYPFVKQNFTVNGVTINTLGTVEKPWKGSDNLRSGYYGIKFWRDPVVTGNAGSPAKMFGDQNAILMRYAQVLLSKAEALYRTGNEAGAMALVQQVRDRAFDKITNASVVVPAPPANGNVLRVILDEYRHELAGEMSVWFLLRRSGEHIKYVKDTYNITVPTGKDIMPIPQKQIGINEALVQNPGY